MRLYTKLFVGALAATALFAALAGSASANRISITNRTIRTVFTPLILDPSFGNNVSCTVTLEGSFHSSTFPKIVGLLLGYITRATVNTPGCQNEEGIRALVRQATLPWHLRYSAFIGTLPNVRLRLQLINAGFDLLNVPLIGTCRYTASPFGIVGGAGGGSIGGASTTITAEPGTSINSETAFCPSGAFNSGATAVTLLNTTTAIVVRLI